MQGQPGAEILFLQMENLSPVGATILPLDLGEICLHTEYSYLAFLLMTTALKQFHWPVAIWLPTQQFLQQTRAETIPQMYSIPLPVTEPQILLSSMPVVLTLTSLQQ